MAFWQNRSISLVDMYIDNSEPTENVGQIHFSLEYDFANTTLVLKIMQVPRSRRRRCRRRSRRVYRHGRAIDPLACGRRRKPLKNARDKVESGPGGA